MARPAHSNLPDTDLEQDDPGKTTTVFFKLRDNALAGRISPIGILLAEYDTVTGAFGANTYGEHITEMPLRIPNVADYTGIQRLYRINLSVKTVSGATGTYRLKDQATTNTGSEDTSVSATYETISLTLNIDAGWIGTDRIILVEFKSSSGSNAAFAKHDGGADAYLEF